MLALDDDPARDADKTNALVKEAIEQGDFDKADTLVNAYTAVFCNNPDDIADACDLLIDAKIDYAIETGNYKRAYDDLDKEYLTDSVLYYDRYQAYYNRICKCIDMMKRKKCSVSDMKKFVNYSIEEYVIYKKHGQWSKRNVANDLYGYIEK